MADFDWKAVVRGVAPTLAGVFGTPAAGVGVKILVDTLLGGSSGDAEQDEMSLSKALAGGATPEVRVKLIEAEAEFKRQAFELQKLKLVGEQARDAAELADLGDARKRDAAFLAAGLRNWRADIMFGLAFIAICGLTWAVWKNAEVTEFTKGIITLVLGRFLGYVDSAYQFEFGSTRTSKQKDSTIERLSGKG